MKFHVVVCGNPLDSHDYAPSHLLEVTTEVHTSPALFCVAYEEVIAQLQDSYGFSLFSVLEHLAERGWSAKQVPLYVVGP